MPADFAKARKPVAILQSVASRISNTEEWTIVLKADDIIVTNNERKSHKFPKIIPMKKKVGLKVEKFRIPNLKFFESPKSCTGVPVSYITV